MACSLDQCGGDIAAKTCVGTAASFNCTCSQFFDGPTCGRSFADAVGPALWFPWWGVVWLEFGLLFVLQLKHLWAVQWKARERTTRDVCVLVNAGSVFLRLLWAVDVKGANMIYSDLVRAALLRLPQVGWLAGVTVTVLIWESITRSVRNERVTRKEQLCTGAVVAVLMLFTVPTTLLAAVDVGASYLLPVSDMALGLYILLLLLAGVVYSRKLMLLLAKYRDAPMMAMVLQSVTVTVTLMTVIGVLMVVAIVLLVTEQVHPPMQHVGEYFSFIVVVHSVLEAGIAWLLYYASVMSTRRRGAPSGGSSGRGLAVQGASSTTPPGGVTTDNPLNKMDGDSDASV